MSDPNRSLLVRLRRRWKQSQRGTVVDSAAVLCALATAILALNAAVPAFSLHSLGHLNASLTVLVRSLNSDLKHGQSTGALIAGSRDFVHSLGHAIESFSAACHRLAQSLFKHGG